MQVKHGVLYLHQPLKHVGQRKEGDDNIFSAGLHRALHDNIHQGERGGRGGGEKNKHGEKTEEHRRDGQENKGVKEGLTGSGRQGF